MNDLSSWFGARPRSSTPAWSALRVELQHADSGNIDVEWLQMDETIVLETEAETA
jgi:hypothetical protein